MEHLFRFYADKDERNLWESALYDITSVNGKKKLAYSANGGHIYINWYDNSAERSGRASLSIPCLEDMI